MLRQAEIGEDSARIGLGHAAITNRKRSQEGAVTVWICRGETKAGETSARDRRSTGGACTGLREHDRACSESAAQDGLCAVGESGEGERTWASRRIHQPTAALAG